MIVHHLDGCAPTPLAHYLKALGILRVVAEQLDPAARGWWEGERFLLASDKDTDQLIAFFLHDYSPTPIFNPWGARSGFYAGSSEKKSRTLLQSIEESTDVRFESFRKSIGLVRAEISEKTGGVKPDDSQGEGKTELILGLKKNLRSGSEVWLDAVVAVVDNGGKGLEQPAIFGTGGSEGSGSYTATFMKALCECLIDHRWDAEVVSALFGTDSSSRGLWPDSFGQFLPSGIGSAWDLLLAFEGACMVRSSVVQRSASTGNRWLSSPFFVAPVSVGFSSSSRLDESLLNKGKELPGRGEQWFPLWAAPVTLRELQSLFRQGQAAVGRKRAVDGFSMAKAVATLGVARGITKFVRYGYLQRNNQATHFAVPLGRFVVPDRVAPTLACLDDLDAWLVRLRREARGREAPARFVQAERRLADALFALTQHADEAPRWLAVLERLADIEALQIHGVGIKAGPIPRLRAQWLHAADDGSAELRLAAALALQCGDADQPAHDSVRRHWLTLAKGRFKISGTGAAQRLAPETDRVMQGRSGEADALALLSRRLAEAAMHGGRRLPLEPGFGLSASRHDLARLIAGDVDLDRCLHLARALMALDRNELANHRPRLTPAPAADWPDDAWLAIRLALLPWPLDGHHAGVDPAIVRRLEAGDAASAVAIASRRLRAADIRCAIRAAAVAPALARRYAAALAFPIGRQTAAQFAKRLSPLANQEYAA